jgi:hypothetical protein
VRQVSKWVGTGMDCAGDWAPSTCRPCLPPQKQLLKDVQMLASTALKHARRTLRNILPFRESKQEAAA